nr:DUF362 domain-containing protein [Chloroflexota bacterium]
MSRVYIAKCPSYDQQAVETALHESLQAFPEATKRIKPGHKVVLKANLLQAKPPEKAITTHPALVVAVAKWVRKLGAIPIIADSPGPGTLFNPRALRHVYQITGMAAAAEEGDAILNYDVRTVQVAYPEGRAAKTLDAIKMAVEADAIISLPKLKTHDLTLFTGAIKNLFGTVPGIVKSSYHARFPSVDQFAAMLVDILSYYKPVLTIMDAVVGMEGDGPSAGTPRHIGLILTSTDGVALDVVATAIVGIPPRSVPPIAAAMRRGLTTGHLEDIEVLGNPIEAVKVSGFRLPRTSGQNMRMIPSFVPAWITDQMLAKPQAGPKCTACGTCVENCPVKAITIVDRRARMDLDHCIRCYCCHELCPENAVELHLPPLARLINRFFSA